MNIRRMKRRHYSRYYALAGSGLQLDIGSPLLPYEKTYPGWPGKSWRS